MMTVVYSRLVTAARDVCWRTRRACCVSSGHVATTWCR